VPRAAGQVGETALGCNNVEPFEPGRQAVGVDAFVDLHPGGGLRRHFSGAGLATRGTGLQRCEASQQRRASIDGRGADQGLRQALERGPHPRVVDGRGFVVHVDVHGPTCRAAGYSIDFSG
jgi:hypothetical protein